MRMPHLLPLWLTCAGPATNLIFKHYLKENKLWKTQKKIRIRTRAKQITHQITRPACRVPPQAALQAIVATTAAEAEAASADSDPTRTLAWGLHPALLPHPVQRRTTAINPHLPSAPNHLQQKPRQAPLPALKRTAKQLILRAGNQLQEQQARPINHPEAVHLPVAAQTRAAARTSFPNMATTAL